MTEFSGMARRGKCPGAEEINDFGLHMSKLADAAEAAGNRTTAARYRVLSQAARAVVWSCFNSTKGALPRTDDCPVYPQLEALRKRQTKIGEDSRPSPKPDPYARAGKVVYCEAFRAREERLNHGMDPRISMAGRNKDAAAAKDLSAAIASCPARGEWCDFGQIVLVGWQGHPCAQHDEVVRIQQEYPTQQL